MISTPYRPTAQPGRLHVKLADRVANLGVERLPFEVREVREDRSVVGVARGTLGGTVQLAPGSYAVSALAPDGEVLMTPSTVDVQSEETAEARLEPITVRGTPSQPAGSEVTTPAPRRLAFWRNSPRTDLEARSVVAEGVMDDTRIVDGAAVPPPSAAEDRSRLAARAIDLTNRTDVLVQILAADDQFRVQTEWSEGRYGCDFVGNPLARRVAKVQEMDCDVDLPARPNHRPRGKDGGVLCVSGGRPR